MSSSDTVIELLRKHSFFQGISSSLLNELSRQTHSRLFQPDEIIFLRGEPSAGLWFIETGSVKIARISADGTEHIGHLLGPGDSFNEIAAIDGNSCPANATALSLAVCWLLPGEFLRRELATNSLITRNVLGLLTQRVRGLNDQIEELALYSVLVRLIRFLILQADNPALSAPGITRAAIAAHLATTPETVTRSLARLQDMGCIRFDRHRIIITDETRLRALALL